MPQFTFIIYTVTRNRIICAGDNTYLDIDANFIYKPDNTPDIELPF